jgi:hypothetical protein
MSFSVFFFFLIKSHMQRIHCPCPVYVNVLVLFLFFPSWIVVVSQSLSLSLPMFLSCSCPSTPILGFLSCLSLYPVLGMSMLYVVVMFLSIHSFFDSCSISVSVLVLDMSMFLSIHSFLDSCSVSVSVLSYYVYFLVLFLFTHCWILVAVSVAVLYMSMFFCPFSISVMSKSFSLIYQCSCLVLVLSFFDSLSSHSLCPCARYVSVLVLFLYCPSWILCRVTVYVLARDMSVFLSCSCVVLLGFFVKSQSTVCPCARYVNVLVLFLFCPSWILRRVTVFVLVLDMSVFLLLFCPSWILCRVAVFVLVLDM